MAEAEHALREVLPRARSLAGHRRLLGHTLRYNAAASSLTGDFESGRRYLDEAATIFNTLGVLIEAGPVIKRDLAHLELRAGNPELALQHAVEAQQTMDALAPYVYFLSARQTDSYSLSIMSACLISLGRYDEAEARAREALDIPSTTQNASNFAYALQHLATVAALGAGGYSRGPIRGLPASRANCRLCRRLPRRRQIAAGVSRGARSTCKSVTRYDRCGSVRPTDGGRREDDGGPSSGTNVASQMSTFIKSSNRLT